MGSRNGVRATVVLAGLAATASTLAQPAPDAAGQPALDRTGAEAKSRFTGRIPEVTIEVRDADAAAEAAVRAAQEEVRRRTQ